MPRKRTKSPAQELGSEGVVAAQASLGQDAPLFDNQVLSLGMMTAAQVAAELGTTERAIRNWVARREIPFVPLGKQLTMFRRDGLREWLQKMEFKPRGRH